MKTLTWIGSSMMDRIKELHECKYMHRDIKPQNFLIGHGKKENKLFLIDFGLSKSFMDPKTGKHIEN